MNTFTRKSLAVALAGASMLSLPDPAEAVRVSSNGTGQVLLYPYYTVRGNSVALDNWRNATAWTAPGSITPDLRRALPQISTVITTIGSEEQVIVTGGATWGGTNSVDPVSAVLMHDTIYNEYVLDTITQSGTDWIITFPPSASIMCR